MDECSLSYAKLPELKRSSLMQKTADQSNKHTRETISVTYICISLPTSNLGNDLVTELLLKSALSCLLRTEQFYANHFISCSLSISLHQLRFFFIFKDQLHCNQASFRSQKSMCCFALHENNLQIPMIGEKVVCRRRKDRLMDRHRINLSSCILSCSLSSVVSPPDSGQSCHASA